MPALVVLPVHGADPPPEYGFYGCLPLQHLAVEVYLFTLISTLFIDSKD